jgi:phospholipid/cholesterol/gamma-HCH transport system substrate-binding protein
MADIDAGQGTVGKLLRDDALYTEATASMSNLREIMEKVNRGDGSVGMLINDAAFYNNAKLTLQKVEKSVESLEDTGPLSVLGIAVGSLF